MSIKWVTLSDEQHRLLSLLRKGKMAGFSIDGLFSKSTIDSQLRKGRIDYDRATGYYNLTDRGQGALISGRVK